MDTELSIIEKFTDHILSRFFHSDSKIFGHAWRDSRFKENYLKSYSGIETIRYQSISNGERERLLFKINARGDANDNCYAEKIEISFVKMISANPIVAPPFNKKSDTTRNKLYGYWGKFIQSSKRVSF
ncbi:MAG: hypothetical protein LBO66_04290 [Deltaproteobacteria bacterium]|nr:hypothetical protein [Deltaproteobacteria bacterium]